MPIVWADRISALRSVQRFRAKLRRRGFDVETITMLIEGYNNQTKTNEEELFFRTNNVEHVVPLRDQEFPANDQTTETTKAEKRKRETKTAGVTTSVSQMPISQLPTKRQRSTTVNDSIMKEKKINKSTFNNNKPNYLKVPDRMFKQMLSTAMEGAETIVQSLDTTEKLQFARDYTHLTNNFYIETRYIDDVFMTSNQSRNQINLLLDETDQRDENIRITRSIGTIVEFLDGLVENKHGQLKTSVFHKPAAEPYILPYSSDHPRHVHCSATYGGLLRAAPLCSNVRDFDKECLHNELTLLLNGYPPQFVSYHFKRFLEQHKAMSVFDQLDDNVYKALHRKLISRPTRREKEQQKIQASLDNSSTEQYQKRKHWDQTKILVHYTFQSGPLLEFKRELRRFWKNH